MKKEAALETNNTICVRLGGEIAFDKLNKFKLIVKLVALYDF